MIRLASRLVLISMAAMLVLAIACADDDDGDGPTGSPGAATPVPNPPSASQSPQPTTPVDPATGLPITFPESFPVYEPTSVSRASDYGDRFVVQWNTADLHTTVAEFYEAGLDAAPWSADEVTVEGEATRITFTGDGYSGELAVAPGSPETIVLLNLVVEE